MRISEQEKKKLSEVLENGVPEGMSVRGSVDVVLRDEVQKRKSFGL